MPNPSAPPQGVRRTVSGPERGRPTTSGARIVAVPTKIIGPDGKIVDALAILEKAA